MFAFSYQGILSSYLDLELLKGRARLLHLWVPLGTAVMGTDCLPYPLPALLLSYLPSLLLSLPAAAAAAKSLQSCPTLCDPIGGSPPGSSVPGSLQARILEWVAISFSMSLPYLVKIKSHQ